MFKKSTLYFSHTNNQNGAVAVIVGLLLTALVGFSALAIDIGYLLTKRNEIQDIADAAALGACMGLGQIYDSMNYTQQQTYVISAGHISFIAGRATATADWYTLDGPGSTRYAIAAEDVHIGQWDWDNNILNETVNQPDSVQVKVRRDVAIDDPNTIGNKVVKTFLAGIFSLFGGNFNTFELTTTATAGLSGLSKVYAGELIAPIGVSLNYPDNCDDGDTTNDNFILNEPGNPVPVNNFCAGWHTFFSNLSDDDLKDKLLELIAVHTDANGFFGTHFPEFTIPSAPAGTPKTKVGNTFNFINGDAPSLLFSGDRIIFPTNGDDPYVINNAGNAYKDMSPPIPDIENPAPFIALFDFYRFRDNDGNDNIWTATLPVYDDGGTCTNPIGGSKDVVGFAKMEIKMEILTTTPSAPYPTKVEMKIICNKQMLKEPVYVDEEEERDFARGGGLIYNAKGFVPNLIQ
jgi:hypothetical protein